LFSDYKLHEQIILAGNLKTSESLDKGCESNIVPVLISHQVQYITALFLKIALSSMLPTFTTLYEVFLI
jgi:hypothetical protein